MRRLLVLGVLLSALVADGSLSFASANATTPSQPPTGAAAPTRDPARGLVYDGLRRSAPGGVCRGAYELSGVSDRAGRPLCTHGPDPAPPGIDVRARREPPATAGATPPPPATAAAAPGSILCDGDGSSGFRVQLIYARPDNVADRYDQFAGSFEQWATAMDGVFDNSAAQTLGSRHVRFVTDSSCRAVVARVVLSRYGDDSFNNTLSELASQGYSRSDRKYLLFMDSTVYCGISQIYPDDRPGQDNPNNGVASSPGMVARVDSGCWGRSNSTEAHELMHTLGGVQPTAPHATPGFHCTDDYDRMCYNDGTGGPVQIRCADSARENVFDCGNDDYFTTYSRVTGWLATHWNTATNRFLLQGGAQQPPPPTTTTTVPANDTTTTTTAPPAPTTTLPPTGGAPSAPRYLRASTPLGGPGVALSWSAPTSSGGSTVSGYRIYRGTSPGALAFLATSPSTAYTDTATVTRAPYYYQVSAVNSAGEGPRSNFAFRTAA